MATTPPVAPLPDRSLTTPSRRREADDLVFAVVLVLLVVRPIADAAGSALAGLASIVLVVTVGLWVVDRRLTGSPLVPSAPDVAVAVLVAAFGVSTLGSDDVLHSAGKLARLTAAAAMFVAVEHLCARPDRRRLLLSGVVGAAVVPVMIGLGGRWVGLDVTETKDQIARLRATFVQSNPFGHFLVVVLLVLVACALVLRGGRRTASVVALVPVVVALGLSYTRVAWVAAAAGIVTVALVVSRGRSAVVLVALGTMGLLVALPPVSSRIGQATAERAAGPDAPTSLEWRLEQWHATWDLGAGNPVAGIGPGMVEQTLANAQPPHNDYLRALVETGVVGLAALLLVLFAMARGVITASRRAVGPWDRTAAAAGAGVLVALAVTLAAANVVDQVVVLWYAFAVLGAAVSVARWPALSAGGPQ